jgi:hypothetical protein
MLLIVGVNNDYLLNSINQSIYAMVKCFIWGTDWILIIWASLGFRALMMEAVRTSESPVNFNVTTRRYIP